MGKVELFLILGAIIMLLFGAKQLPKTARSVGESVAELKKGLSSNTLTSSSAKETEQPVAQSAKREGSINDGR